VVLRSTVEHSGLLTRRRRRRAGRGGDAVDAGGLRDRGQAASGGPGLDAAAAVGLATAAHESSRCAASRQRVLGTRSRNDRSAIDGEGVLESNRGVVTRKLRSGFSSRKCKFSRILLTNVPRRGRRPPLKRVFRECVLFIGTQFSILYTFVYSPA
jgi:hypothetical protein